MAFRRGRFGIESDSDSAAESSMLPWVLLVAGVVAVVSLGYRISRRPPALPEPRTGMRGREQIEIPRPVSVKAPPPVRVLKSASAARTPGAARSPQLRNLLLRLGEVRDVERQISTIEQIRGLPCEQLAGETDLVADLTRQLGVLNLQRLFEMKSPQWVREIRVASGGNATRIARENGSTLGAMERLNGGPGSVRKLRVGQRVKVMDHPRFRLVLRRGSRQADLMLNGKFFKRYELRVPPAAVVGEFAFPGLSRRVWRERGIAFAPDDLAELEQLVPAGSPVRIAEAGVPAAKGAK